MLPRLAGLRELHLAKCGLDAAAVQEPVGRLFSLLFNCIKLFH